MIRITVAENIRGNESFNFYTVPATTKPSCLECGMVNTLLHTCGYCHECCYCTTCSKCQQIADSYCQMCHACHGCCTCVYCTSCRRIVTGVLCTSCGGCARCCNTTSGTSHGGVIFARRTVDLDKYVPTKKELKLNPSPRLLSAEVETCGYSVGKATDLNHHLKAWNSSVVRDGSLPEGGFEINTHPAGGDHWMRMCSELYTAMTKAKVKFNHQAGCHIHVDARDLGYTQVANMIRLYYYTETAMYRLIAKERRNNHYCAMCASGYMMAITRVAPAIKRATKDLERTLIYRQAIMNELYKTKASLVKGVPKSFVVGVRQDKSSGPRYRGLNLHSWIHRGTIEFRFPGHQPSAHDLQMMGCMLANFLDLSKRTEEEILGMVEPIEKQWKTVPDTDAIANASTEFLCSLSPMPAVTDWIRERTKFYNSLNSSGAPFSTQL